MKNQDQPTTANSSPENQWEKSLIKDVIHSMQKEQRRERYFIYSIRLLRTIGFVVMMIVAAIIVQRSEMLPWETKKGKKPHAAILAIKGAIMPENANSADRVIPALQEAFKNEFAKSVIISINSPGGSAVQAGRIYDEILSLKKQYPEKPVYAVIDDIGASGGYYIAIAADEIYANRASLVGSIGVIASSFGFVDVMEKIGVERRTFTAGENKNFMDPFSPLSAGAKIFWDDILGQIHQQFIVRVKENRGDKLSSNPDLFNGLVWSGEQAVSLGLIDGLSSVETLARRFDPSGTIIDYSPTEDVFKRLSSRLSTQIKDMLHSFTLQY